MEITVDDGQGHRIELYYKIKDCSRETDKKWHLPNFITCLSTTALFGSPNLNNFQPLTPPINISSFNPRLPNTH